MTEAIIVALITGAVSVFGVIIANGKTMAVIENEIKHLTEEVGKHNNFANRIPVLEEQVRNLEERIKELER